MSQPPEASLPFSTAFSRVSVVIPARNEEPRIGQTVGAVFDQAPEGVELEVVVADDGSTDDTAAVASGAGARVVPVRSPGEPGSPGAARNRGAAAATGDPIIFLDADCIPGPGWLAALLAAHAAGETVVGGALDAPDDLPFTGRCDHYCGSYHVHPGRPAGYVPNHTPANLSVRRDAFLATAGFTEQGPVADGHEELRWQGQLRRTGTRIRFEPAALVHHHNRTGVGNLLRRHFRWGYSSVEGKAETGTSRWNLLYRHPRLLIAAGLPLAFAHTFHTLGCWLRAGKVEPVAMLPLLLTAHLSYAAGLTLGGWRWLRRRGTGTAPVPRWR
ncbi:MAG TPA: glycosyltransferase [Thermoanaerobaculia bacterium]|nr:glycosyltransferase [Thermoanaerobaculia bacterium]